MLYNIQLPGEERSGPMELKTNHNDFEKKVIEVIKTCYDPEIPVDIYELGLIYRVDADEKNNVHVLMTLTSPACPVAGTLPGDVENKIKLLPDVGTVEVELTFDPPWDKNMMSEAAKFELGFF